MDAILNLHCGEEFTKHLGRSVTLLRANNNGDHVIVEYVVDGVASVACYSFGWKVRRFGSQFKPVGSVGTMSTLAKAVRWCRLRSEGRPDDNATFAEAVAV